ncbi:MAG: hypothetical protein NTW29_15005 [Bacteroidetes bacterium]|nr:hypothetical protein [Bacteroidota bacterium]
MAANQLTPQQLLEALLDGNNDLLLLDNLIAAGEAAFHIIYNSTLDDDMKQVTFQVEKRFQLYATLLQFRDGNRVP